VLLQLLFRTETLHEGFSVPYMTARIFFSNYYTYSFPVNTGGMLVHLYFNPSTYGDYAPANACFGVAADNLTL
jgi:hypothetical protein